MKTILLTGFEPFGGEHSNPSWEAVRRLDGKHLHDGSRIVTALLPCAFGAALDSLSAKIRLVAPQLVVCVGQAGGRADLTIERVAINVDDAPIPDNLGCRPIDARIVADGPVGYFSSLPLKAIVQALHAKGIPASVSQTAGTYVCNHVFYGLMHMASSRHAIQQAGFVHIPYLPEQAAAHPGAPSMSLSMMMDGLMVLLETSISVKHDSQISGGTTH
jgi:pyroglutamyl-peptidase